MRPSIFSEVGTLQDVLVHCPGDEIVHMTQDDLHGLLFDDILSPDRAVAEHALLRELLGAGGARVRDIKDLLEEGLRRAPQEAVYHLVSRCCELALVPELVPILREWPADKLAHTLIAWLPWNQVGESPVTLARLRVSLLGSRERALSPVPNLMFMRDPCLSIYDRFMPARMATRARAREPVLVAFAMRYGLGTPADGLLFPQDGHGGGALEGGDLLVLSDDMLFVGCSERTRPEAIEEFARHALFPAFPELRRIYAVMMPKQRSIMHLDTILTQVDRDLFLCHEPLVCGDESDRALQVVRLEQDREPALVAGATVADVLREELGASLRFSPCGGHNPLHQEREQWTDGANAVALGPSHIVLYSRNTWTIDTLCREHGFMQITINPEQPPAERRDVIAAGMDFERTIFAFTGSELSRARGGGRCLTMPLSRAPLEP